MCHQGDLSKLPYLLHKIHLETQRNSKPHRLFSTSEFIPTQLDIHDNFIYAKCTNSKEIFKKYFTYQFDQAL
jgi:hypothetical protein